MTHNIDSQYVGRMLDSTFGHKLAAYRALQNKDVLLAEFSDTVCKTTDESLMITQLLRMEDTFADILAEFPYVMQFKIEETRTRIRVTTYVVANSRLRRSRSWG